MRCPCPVRCYLPRLYPQAPVQCCGQYGKTPCQSGFASVPQSRCPHWGHARGMPMPGHDTMPVQPRLHPSTCPHASLAILCPIQQGSARRLLWFGHPGHQVHSMQHAYARLTPCLVPSLHTGSMARSSSGAKSACRRPPPASAPSPPRLRWLPIKNDLARSARISIPALHFTSTGPALSCPKSGLVDGTPMPVQLRLSTSSALPMPVRLRLCTGMALLHLVRLCPVHPQANLARLEGSKQSLSSGVLHA